MSTDTLEVVRRFQLTRILNNDPQAKSIVLLGKSGDEDAIITFEKTHLLVDEEFNISKVVADLEVINHNDIYSWSLVLLEQSLPGHPAGKLNLIYPATETHISKYQSQNHHFVTETPEMYQKYVVPYINSMKGDRIKWVYNILFEGKESESFVHHDEDPETGFVLLPDMKWDKINMDTLYLCCIVKRQEISSVRDLNESHLPFLINLKKKIAKITSELYPVQRDELRIFIHYQPSYYHFHVHVVNIKHPGLGFGINIGKAIFLDDVIENIQLLGDYYQKRNLMYMIGENHGLWKDEGFRKAHYNNLEQDTN